MLKLLLATTNPGKIDRFRLLLSQLSTILGTQIATYTPADFGIDNLIIAETGATEAENAYLKAKGYWQALPINQKMPCLALDTGCYLEGVLPEEEPGQHVRRITGAGESYSSTGDLDMIQYFSQLCHKYGGQIPGYYLDASCLFAGYATKPRGTADEEPIGQFTPQAVQTENLNLEFTTEVVLQTTNHRPIQLTANIVGPIHPGFPMMSMWRSVITGKYRSEMSNLEYLQELQPSLEALYRILLSLPEPEGLILGVYRATMQVRPRSLAVIQKGDKFLGFTKNYGGSQGKITWVGGGVDFPENPAVALLREVKEELGYTTASIKKALGSKALHYFTGPDYATCAATFGYLVTIDDYEAKVPAEIDDGRYTLSEIRATEFLYQSQIEIAKIFLKRAIE